MSTETIKRPTQEQINSALWATCDSLRGALSSDQYKDYILIMMFLKYLSDVWRDKVDEYKKQYGDDPELLKRKMKRERFVLPDDCTFEYIYENRNEPNIGERIDKVLSKIEDENIKKLDGVFRGISFNSDKIGSIKDRNKRLQDMINDFANPVLDFRPSVLGNKEDIIGNGYMYLIEKFAAGGGKSGGEFFTPHEISTLIARLMQPKPNSRICDPTCGSGSLLIEVAEHVKDKNGNKSTDFSLYGQESTGDTWALCKLNMFIHGMDSAQIEWGDTLNSPRLLEKDNLMKFDVVVANPPFSLKKWGYDEAENDIHHRFTRGVPPKTKGDYAFILHMIETTLPTGKVGVVTPHGVLFRGSAEGKIREQLIEENLLEAVVGLPSNLFFGTGIPAAILVFNKAKGDNTDVLFIDASREYQEGKKQNKLREEDIAKIVDTYNKFETIDKYSYRATIDEIKENDYNLNIPRYVDTFEEEEAIDLRLVQKDIEETEKELAEVKAKMQQYLKELGLN